MATLSVRNLPDHVHQRLRIHAAKQGLSVEETVRQILDQATQPAERLGDQLAAFAQSRHVEPLVVERDPSPPRSVNFDDYL